MSVPLTSPSVHTSCPHLLPAPLVPASCPRLCPPRVPASCPVSGRGVMCWCGRRDAARSMFDTRSSWCPVFFGGFRALRDLRWLWTALLVLGSLPRATELRRPAGAGASRRAPAVAAPELTLPARVRPHAQLARLGGRWTVAARHAGGGGGRLAAGLGEPCIFGQAARDAQPRERLAGLPWPWPPPRAVRWSGRRRGAVWGGRTGHGKADGGGGGGPGQPPAAASRVLA